MIPDTVYIAGSKYQRVVVPTPDDGFVIIRFPHDQERVNVNADGGGDHRYRGNLPAYAGNLRGGPVRRKVTDTGKALPEVYRVDPDHQTVADCAVQWMWRRINPELNDKRWSSLMDGGLDLMNGTGCPPYHNCITGEDDEQKFPRFHAPLVFGGAVGKAKIDGDIVRISSIIISEPIPSGAEVLADPWAGGRWMYETSINPRGEINMITRPSGEDSNGPNVPVRVPFVTTVPVSLPLVEVHVLPEGFIPPSPLWMSG